MILKQNDLKSVKHKNKGFYFYKIKTNNRLKHLIRTRSLHWFDIYVANVLTVYLTQNMGGRLHEFLMEMCWVRLMKWCKTTANHKKTNV